MCLIKCNILRSRSSEKSINHCLAAAGVPGENTCFPSLSLTLFVSRLIIKPTRLVGPASSSASEDGRARRAWWSRRGKGHLQSVSCHKFGYKLPLLTRPLTLYSLGLLQRPPSGPLTLPLAFPTHQQRQAQDRNTVAYQTVSLPLSRDQIIDAVC